MAGGEGGRQEAEAELDRVPCPGSSGLGLAQDLPGVCNSRSTQQLDGWILSSQVTHEGK